MRKSGRYIETKTQNGREIDIAKKKQKQKYIYKDIERVSLREAVKDREFEKSKVRRTDTKRRRNRHDKRDSICDIQRKSKRYRKIYIEKDRHRDNATH